MTIAFAPQSEAELKEIVTREGYDENTFPEAILAEVLESADRPHSGAREHFLLKTKPFRKEHP